MKDSNRNYDLKSKAVEDLLEANAGQAPQYTPEELDRYRSKRGIRIPEIVKILFIKAWFAGAVCFFFLWGLSAYVPNLMDMLFVTAVALGMVTDLLTNNVLRFIEKSSGNNDRWMVFPPKGVGSFVGNIVYSFFIVFCVYTLYSTVNALLMGITGDADTVALGVEPILFGLLCMGFDMLFVGFRRMFLAMVRDARNAASK